MATYPSSVIFKLNGRLAKSYILKTNEKILESNSDYIIVSATNINKDKLIHRLIRYFDDCEILYPKDCRNRMINLIDDMEKMYL
jgi:predicted DNA-binding transcriptional regulator YafY